MLTGGIAEVVAGAVRVMVFGCGGRVDMDMVVLLHLPADERSEAPGLGSGHAVPLGTLLVLAYPALPLAFPRGVVSLWHRQRG